MIQHQEIAERIAAIDAEKARAEACASKELESLQELCGGIGHKFVDSGLTISIEHGEPFQMRKGRRHQCSVCRFAEWNGPVVVEQPSKSGVLTMTCEQGFLSRLRTYGGGYGGGGLVI